MTYEMRVNERFAYVQCPLKRLRVQLHLHCNSVSACLNGSRIGFASCFDEPRPPSPWPPFCHVLAHVSAPFSRV